MTTVTIHELTGERRQWTNRFRTANAGEAIARAIGKAFGNQHGFFQDSGLPAGYGSIVRHLARRERGSSTWAAEVVLGHVRIDVEG